MLLNFDSVQKSSLQEQLRGHMSGITKQVMNSPCCDCQSGKSVNRALQDQGGRSNSFSNRRRGGGYRNGFNRNGNYNNKWNRNRNRGYNNRGRNRGRGGYGRGGQSNGYQNNNYNRDYHNVPPPNQQQQGGYSNNSNRGTSTGKKGKHLRVSWWAGKKF